MASFNMIDLNVYLSQNAQIALLQIEAVIILFKYANYTNVS